MSKRPFQYVPADEGGGYIFVPLQHDWRWEPIYLPPGVVKRKPMLDWKPKTETERGWIEFDGYWWASFPVSARLIQINERNLHGLAYRWRFRMASFPEGEDKARKRGRGRKPERYILVMDLEHYSIFRQAWNKMCGTNAAIVSPSITRDKTWAKSWGRWADDFERGPEVEK